MLFQNDIPIDVAGHRYTQNMQVSSGTKNNSSPNEPSCTTLTVSLNGVLLDNKSISDLEKLQYLQVSVRGDAAKLILGFGNTLDNLKNCWDILCNRVFIERDARDLNELKFVKPDIKKGNVRPLNSFNKSNVNTTVAKCNQVKSGVKPDIVKVTPSADTPANSVVTVSNNCTQSAEGNVLLSTALINIKSKHGQQITCRALIDNASQNSLISKQCADHLKLPLKHSNHELVGVNETFAETSLYSTNFEFSYCVSSEKFQVKALLVSKVTSAMPNFPTKYHEWHHIEDLTLADPTFYIENEIEILLGADVFMTFISATPIMGPKGTPSILPKN
ncbi:DUF1758 domain-containing protein [Trichonephila clavipes]|nr:DUF1758 domain-containing protein [Trichonephila clavipes]